MPELLKKMKIRRLSRILNQENKKLKGCPKGSLLFYVNLYINKKL